jgi:exodeoxyribonuclease VII large subunit
MQALELARLRAQLETEGLFDQSRKRPLPVFPRRIAVVTSPTGAVIHDIQTVLRRRFPLADLLVSPAQVQGDAAVNSLLNALDLVAADGTADLVIVARGGGSAEDLSAFNDERLARAAFAFPIPVISAIGHETDYSILDDVADLRAPTPTAAAELATPDIADLALDLLDSRDRLFRMLLLLLERRRHDLDQTIQRLDRSSPVAVLVRNRERLAVDLSRLRIGVLALVRAGQMEHRVQTVRLRGAGLRICERQRNDINTLSDSLRSAFQIGFDVKRSSLQVAAARIQEMNPTGLLERGFSVLTNSSGHLIDSTAGIAAGDSIRAVVRDGTIWADVTAVQPETT